MTDQELTADDNWCPDCGDPRGACRCERTQPVSPQDESGIQMQRYVYMEDEGPSKDDRGLWVLYADAQRALDAEKKKVKTLRSALAQIANTRDNYEKRIIAEKALIDTEGTI